MNREKNRHLIIEINKEIHKEFKLQAMKLGMTLRAWVIQACIESIKKQKEYDEPAS